MAASSQCVDGQLTETRITTNESIKVNTSIYGNRIVWQDNRNGNWDVCMYNLSTSREKQITTNESIQWCTAIYGDRIIWTDMRNGNWDISDIYIYDLSTSREIQITTNKSDRAFPAIEGDKIVQQDRRNGNYDIYMYDLSTSRETQITTNKSDQERPDIYRDRIVWADNRNGNYNIYMYNISTPRETQITINKNPLNTPLISTGTGQGGWILVTAMKAPISTCVPSLQTNPVAYFSVSPSSGNTPLNVTFSDKSTGMPTAWNWNFGDGTNSTEQNPTHIYSTAGNYTVTLTASSANGTDTKTSEINILRAYPKSGHLL